MNSGDPILDRKSKWFFGIFFSAIAVSIALTFYNLHYLQNFKSFTNADTIPDPIQFYIDGYHTVVGWLMHPNF